MTYGIKVWQIFPKPRTYQDVMGASPTSRRDTNNSEGMKIARVIAMFYMLKENYEKC